MGNSETLNFTPLKITENFSLKYKKVVKFTLEFYYTFIQHQPRGSADWFFHEYDMMVVC